MPTQPILQYEFFLANVSSPHSFDDILTETQERLDDNIQLILAGQKPGFGIKCVVRAYDHENMVTEWAQTHKRLTDERDAILDTFHERNFIKKWLLTKRLDEIKVNLYDLNEFIRLYALDYIDRAFKGSVNMALENSDWSFSPIPRDNLHELKEAITKARHHWLFVFEPNELLADKNEIIVSLM